MLGFVEFLGKLARGDDREVIADFGAVENPAISSAHPFVLHRFAGVRREVGDDAAFLSGNFLQGADDGADVIVGQIPGVGSRIGERFVFFVERLGQLKRPARAEPETPIGFPLQGGQIVELGRRLLAGLLFSSTSAFCPWQRATMASACSRSQRRSALAWGSVSFFLKASSNHRPG